MTLTPIICGYIPSFIYVMYISELKNPGWMAGKHLAITIIPYLTVTISLLLMKDSLTEINSIYDIPEVIGKADVLVRIIGLALFFLYGVAPIFIPEDSKHKLTGKTKLIMIQAGSVIASITSIFGLGMNIVGIQLLHVPILLSIDFLILKIEIPSQRDCGRC